MCVIQPEFYLLFKLIGYFVDDFPLNCNYSFTFANSFNAFETLAR